MTIKKPIQKRVKRVGPWSRDKSLRFIDERTFEGRLVNNIKKELYAHLGGNPTVAEQILIQAVAIKAMRITHFAKLFAEGSGGDNVDQVFLTLTNSLRSDLLALKLDPKLSDKPAPTLQSLIEGSNEHHTGD